MKRKPIFDKAFFKAMLPLALPIAFQNLLVASFGMIDTIMIGVLGDDAIAAVGLANQVTYFWELIAFGMASGCAVFIAQYHGSGNKTGMSKSVGAALTVLAPLCLIFVLGCTIFSKQVMGLLTDDTSLVVLGSEYLLPVAFSYIGIALSQVLGVALRCTERIKLPMLASGVSAVINVGLNYVLIFGKLGLPVMGVKGAAIATAVSSLAAPIIMYAASQKKGNILNAPIREMFDIRGFFSTFLKRALPVIGNEAVWSFSVVLINMVFGRMGKANYAAYTASHTVENLVLVFYIGICNACNILVGKHIGAGDIDGAKRLAKQFLCFSPVMGIFLGGIVIALRYPVFSLFDLSSGAFATAVSLLLIYGIELGVRNIPYIAVVGIFRAGGETRIGLIGDAISQYVFILPTVIIAGLVCKLPFITTYILMLIVDDTCKCLIYLPYFRSMKWIKPIENKN